ATHAANGGTRNRGNTGAFGGLLGNLGGLFGGASTTGGGRLSGALGDLIGQFSSNGHGDTARSWVGTGPTRPVAPTQLEEALGEDTLRELSLKTGLSREE